MIISLVVAASENNVIGKDNKLLWHLPTDMAFFKNITWGMPVIMGRKTFDSLGKPLKGRTNIIISRKVSETESGGNLVWTNSLDDAIRKAAETDAKEAYVIGGGEIYRQAMPIADNIYLTRVGAVLEGDTYFPQVDENSWKINTVRAFEADEKHAYPFRIEHWIRK